MVYEQRSAEVYREVARDVLEDRLDNPALTDNDVLGAIATMFAETVAGSPEETLADIADAAFVATATGIALDLKAAEYGIQRREAVPATGVVEFSRSTDAPEDFVIPEGTRVQTRDGSISFETTEQVTLDEGTQTVEATVEATTGGPETNLPPDKLVAMSSPPTGIESVTNPIPTGDEDETDTAGNSLVPGIGRETDSELRERVFQSASIGGAATAGSIETAVLDLNGTRSVTVFSNESNETDEDGLPPYSNEIIVVGGDEQQIAEALVDTVSVTELLRLQGGVIGTGVTRSVFVSALNDSVDVSFARPIAVELTIDVEVAARNGDADPDEVKDGVVEYVGGTRTDGSVIPGLGAGEDVVIDRVENAIVSTATGVEAIASLTVDADGDGTDDRTENENGIEVIAVEREEQAVVDAVDVDVTEV